VHRQQPKPGEPATQPNFGAVFFLCPQIPAESADPSPHWPLVVAFNILTDSLEISVRRYIHAQKLILQHTQHCRNSRSTTIMSSVNPGTLRGAPNRGQARGAIPFAGSPGASAIPRPVLESTPTGTTSEAGASSLSTSRQKQTKRDEVCSLRLPSCPSLPLIHPTSNRSTNMAVTRPSAASSRTTSPKRST
jgi:hypothetical protein